MNPAAADCVSASLDGKKYFLTARRTAFVFIVAPGLEILKPNIPVDECSRRERGPFFLLLFSLRRKKDQARRAFRCA